MELRLLWTATSTSTPALFSKLGARLLGRWASQFEITSLPPKSSGADPRASETSVARAPLLPRSRTKRATGSWRLKRWRRCAGTSALRNGRLGLVQCLVSFGESRLFSTPGRSFLAGLSYLTCSAVPIEKSPQGQQGPNHEYPYCQVDQSQVAQGVEVVGVVSGKGDG